MENQAKTNNPWKGLRTYLEGEKLYGRSEEINILSLLILQSHQTVMYGKSGIGKSSILNAGIFPIIRKKGVFPIYVRFEHNVDVSYLQQIKDSINREIKKSDGKITIIKLADKSGEETLWEFFHRIEYRDEEGLMLKPLIVFDQFEEIFTLEKDKDKVNKFFRELADLINNVMPEGLSEIPIISNSENITTDSTEGMLNLGLDAFSQISYSYKTDSDYHLVFTLREDFLSYLERNTVDIPALKNNRYCLQPINEEQAAEIIMQPQPGLVDLDVAKQIIEKVTGETNIELDGKPKIQVDSAILSLYLSRLYDKMVAVGDSKITSDLVEEYSANIIEDFYNDAINGLSEESIKNLEETLINDNGRRDNRDRSTILNKCALTNDQLHHLIHDVKLLREFVYGGDIRIEYIHDVLCDVVIKHRNEREEAKKLEALREKAKKDKRKLIIRATLIASSVILLVILGSGIYLKKTENIKIVDQKQNVVITLKEDSTVYNFWKARLLVTGSYQSGKDTLLYSYTIDRDSVSKKHIVNTDSCLYLKISLDFGDFQYTDNYKNISDKISVADIMESPFHELTISRNVPIIIPYNGRLLLDIDGIDMPLENTMVMLDDALTTTDSLGYFKLSLFEKPKENASLMFAKTRLGVFEIPAFDNLQEDNYIDEKIFRILPSDSLKSFFNKVAELDTIARWNYKTVGTNYCSNKGANNGIHVKFVNGKEDRLKMYWVKDNRNIGNDKVSLSGYFLFNKDAEQYNKIGKGEFAKYIGSGYIDKKTKKDENNASYRNFVFTGYNAASNDRVITGRYYTNSKGAGLYCGDISYSKNKIATFGQ